MLYGSFKPVKYRKKTHCLSVSRYNKRHDPNTFFRLIASNELNNSSCLEIMQRFNMSRIS